MLHKRPKLLLLEDRLAEYMRGPQLASFLLGLGTVLLGLWVFDIGLLLVLAGLGFGIVFLVRRGPPADQAPARCGEHVDRADLAKRLATALRANQGRIVVISGTSGVGKSVALQQVVEKLREEDQSWIEVEKNYGAHRVQAHKQLLQRAQEAARPGLVVFDQFERVFLLEEKATRSELAVLCRLLAECNDPKGRLTCVLVLREESFFHLRVFGRLIPRLDEVEVIGGLDRQKESEAWTAFETLLRDRVLTDRPDLVATVLEDCLAARRAAGYHEVACDQLTGESAASGPEQILPVEAISAAEGIAFRLNRSGGYLRPQEYRERGGIRGAMHDFFDTHLKGYAGGSQNAARVLGALSVRPRESRGLGPEEIAEISNLPPREVGRILRHFEEESGLLTKIDGKYDWVHDYFAEQFNEASGTILDPQDRDNIAFFWERLGSSASARGEDRVRKIQGRNQFGLLLFLIAFLLLWGRTLSPLLAKAVMAGPDWALAPLYSLDIHWIRLIDVSYLPIAVALTGWSWYVTSLYRRVLCRLNEGPIARAHSYFVATLSTILVSLTIASPGWWLALIGLGGAAVGTKYIAMSFAMRQGLKPTNWYSTTGVITTLNSSLTAGAGSFYALLFAVPPLIDGLQPELLAGISFGAMVVMAIFASLVTWQHIDQGVVPVRLGSHRRYSR